MAARAPSWRSPCLRAYFVAIFETGARMNEMNNRAGRSGDQRTRDASWIAAVVILVAACSSTTTTTSVNDAGTAPGGGGAASDCLARCTSLAKSCGQSSDACASECETLTEVQLACLEGSSATWVTRSNASKPRATPAREQTPAAPTAAPRPALRWGLRGAARSTRPRVVAPMPNTRRWCATGTTTAKERANAA